MRTLVLSLMAMAGATVLMADDKKPPDGPTADPKGTPLELSVTGKKTTYRLDTGGKSPAEYKKEIEAAAKAGRALPEPPEVELTVVVKNTGDKPLQVWAKGDPVVLTLELKGDGAVNVPSGRASTLELRVPSAVEVPAGKTVEFPVKSLSSGHRGMGRYSYWTAPGEYELVATLKTGVSPKPAGAKEQDGFGLVTLTSAPLKITVEGKK